LMLAVLKVTHARLGAADFVLFNTVLFSLGVASAFFSPSLRAVWRTGDRQVAVDGATVNVVLSLVLVVGLFLLNRTLFAVHSLFMAVAITAATALYVAAKAVERMIYAYGFQRQRYMAGFGASFLFGTAELATAALPAAPVNLVLRLAAPVLVFGVGVAVGSRSFGRVVLAEAAAGLGRARRLFRAEHLTRLGAMSVLYTVLFTVAGMLERIYPSLLSPAGLQGDVEAVTDYLLILSYGVAFQSLLSITVDWARPRIVASGGVQPGASRTVGLAAGVIAAAGAAACVAGYPLFHELGLVPEWIGAWLWSLIIARFTAQVLLFLCHIDLVISGRLGRAAIPWAVIIAAQAMAIGGDISVESLRRALTIAVVLTSALALGEGALLLRRLAAGRNLTPSAS
ncbi:MAG: hypothetical protein KY444_01535, partial [Gemmatimonadetes bacterium]|nr:hypothetical protein [Gemmatimonadota bacterium]